MMSLREFANHASFQAFVNCYLREVDSGTWHEAEAFAVCSGLHPACGERWVVELPLEAGCGVLAIHVSYRSLVGRHTLTRAYRRSAESDNFRVLDDFSTQLLLIESLYARAPDSEQRMELMSRLIESHQVMRCYLEQHSQGQASRRVGNLAAGFIDSEQGILFGHWLHPTPKSRQGMASWQHLHYAPELGGRFQLHFFAARRNLVEQASILETAAEEISRRIACQGPEQERAKACLASLGNFCLLPVHPMQAEWLLHRVEVRELIDQGQLVHLGRLGPEFTPTSSVRTVYSEGADFMLKLSIPVKITNSVRINLQSELWDSVWLSKLLRSCGLITSFSQFRCVEDPAFITLRLPGVEETGFETIFRMNPFGRWQGGETRPSVHSIAALVQDPLPGESHSLLAQIVRSKAEGNCLRSAALRWYHAYFKCALHPTIQIYDQFGIALEAHQQNSLLAFDPHGLPDRFYYRDIQGLAISEAFRERSIRLVPELAEQRKVFEPDEVVQNGLGYYLMFNHLYAVIHRLAVDGLVDEASLLEVTRHKLLDLLPELQGLGATFVEGLLNRSLVPCKANLLTRMRDLDELRTENELAVYCEVDNPLWVAPVERRTKQFLEPAHPPHTTDVRTVGHP